MIVFYRILLLKWLQGSTIEPKSPMFITTLLCTFRTWNLVETTSALCKQKVSRNWYGCIVTSMTTDMPGLLPGGLALRTRTWSLVLTAMTPMQNASRVAAATCPKPAAQKVTGVLKLVVMELLVHMYNSWDKGG